MRRQVKTQEAIAALLGDLNNQVNTDDGFLAFYTPF